MATERNFGRHLLRDFGGAFSVLTGISFLMSALIQEIVFWTWGLDFTTVASIEDIIFGGLRFLFILIGVMFGILPAVVGFSLLISSPYPRMRSLPVYVCFMLTGLGLGVFFLISLRVETVHRGAVLVGPIVTASIGVFVASIPLLLAGFVSRNRRMRIVDQIMPGNKPLFIMALIGICVTSFLVTANRNASNMYLVADQTSPEICRQPPGIAFRILWTGTRVLVVTCNGYTILIRDPQNATIYINPLA